MESDQVYNLALQQLHILDNIIRMYADKIQEHKAKPIIVSYYANKLTRANKDLEFGQISLDSLRDNEQIELYNQVVETELGVEKQAAEMISALGDRSDKVSQKYEQFLSELNNGFVERRD